jgi:hypothetical protein
MGTGWTSEVRFPDRGTGFSFSRHTQPPKQWVPVAKRLEPQAVQSPSSSADVKNV